MTDLWQRATAILKRLERGSAAPFPYEVGSCPTCGYWETSGHSSHCELVALIRDMEESPMRVQPIGTADAVERAEKARGTCPHCGLYNVPDGDSQIGQEIGKMYCVSCGEVWDAAMDRD